MEAKKITRPLFQLLLTLLVIFIGIGLNNWLASQKDAPQRNFAFNTLRVVPVIEVEYADIPFFIEGSGRVIAANNVNISAEVSGDVIQGSVALKRGNSFSKGDLLFSIDKTEAEYNLYAQKSQFLTALAGILADLKIDYPEAYEKWQSYFESIEVDKPMPDLPETESSAEKTFLATKGILNQYYSIISTEERLEKYMVYAPYGGVIKEVFVEDGGTVNPGTAVINISSSNQVELEVPVKKEDLDIVKVGDLAMVNIASLDTFVPGTVNRISDIIDVRTQSFLAYVSVVDQSSFLKEGMYTSVKIVGGVAESCMELPRKAIFEENFVYEIKDSLLLTKPIEVVRQGTRYSIIRGLPEGSLVVNDALVNAYDGMKVAPMQTQQAR